VGGRVPREYIPAVQHAIEVESRQGQVAGYEVLDFKARLVDGKFHDVDSSALAFEIATRACFREAQRLSNPKLLEPAEMFGYINFLRSATSGRGSFTMIFDHYEEVPANLVDKLMEKEAK
jgi:elongation factor G